jgi:hypothetical protein
MSAIENNKKVLDKFPTLLYVNCGNIAATCKQLGIPRSTYAYHFKNDLEFRQKCLEIDESLLDLAESKALELIKEKNPQMIMFFLKTKGKQRGYVERTEVNELQQRQVQIIVKE